MEDWPADLEALLDQLHVDVVMLFGDCRPIHAPVHEIAHRYGLKIGVFEEGYVRPAYITLERIGVNGHSVIPRNPGSFPWLRSVWRKQYYVFKERGILARLTGELKGQFFMVPLQVRNDSQVHTHSDFDSIRHFIQQVMTSFAQHAPSNTTLVIKHHPLDRAYHDYSSSIRKWIKEIGLQGRCLYIHDQHLPTLLQSACGVVVINSTVGLSAISHGTPVKVCGKAVYDIKGLTFQGSLDEFWRQSQPSKPDISLL